MTTSRIFTFAAGKRPVLGWIPMVCLKCFSSTINNAEPWREHYGPVVLEICHEAIQQVYMARERGTIQDTLIVAIMQTKARQLRLDSEHENHPDMVPRV